MKIKSIGIKGFHKENGTVYEFGGLSPYTYICGRNGAGKSTVLQAIQYGILGYVPETGKTKEATISHCNGDSMSVRIRMDDDRVMTREHTRKKSKFEEEFTDLPDIEDPSILLGNLQLPVFNFNEFISMSPNTLKDYFISVFPDTLDSGISIAAEMDQAVRSEQFTESDFIIEHISAVKDMPDTLETVRSLNEQYKAELSAAKASADRIQHTVQSLVYYDDCEGCQESIDDLSEKITDAHRSLDEVNEQLTKLKMIQAQAAEIERLKDRIMPDEESRQAESRLVFLANGMEIFIKARNEADSEFKEKQASAQSLKRIIDSDAVCPYTSTQCDRIREKIGQMESEYTDLAADMAALKRKAISTDEEYRKYFAEHEDLAARFHKSESAKAQLAAIMSTAGDMDPSITDESCARRIATLSEMITEMTERKIHLTANEKYSNLIEEITAEKYQVEQQIEILKKWIKLTDVNGLQAKFADAPFRKFEQRVTEILHPAFGDQVTASFDSSDSSKFSFGIIRDGKYIRFSTMSSGEKCVFTLALLIALTECGNGLLKLILIDDIFDHLDDEMIVKCFEIMRNTTGIQFIVAGVKQCKAVENQTIWIGAQSSIKSEEES